MFLIGQLSHLLPVMLGTWCLGLIFWVYLQNTYFKMN